MGKKFAEYSKLDLSEVNGKVLKKWDENQVFAKKFLCPPGHALDPEHGPGPPHPPVPLLEARFLGVQDAILNIVRGRSTHGEECVSFDVKDLPTHEVQHMGPYFMDPASVPQPFRQRVQHGKVLVVPIQEGSRKRLILQPVQPIFLRGRSTPESSKISFIPNSGQRRLYRKKYYPEIFYIALKMQ